MNEKNLRAKREEMQETFSLKVKRIEEWLEDPQLQQWKSKLQEADEEMRGSIPFFYLFDKEDKSVSKRLRNEGLRFAYGSYMLSSQVSHGSSMEYFIHIGDDTVIPNFTGSTEKSEGLASEVISGCNLVFFLLAIMNHFLLSNVDLRM